MVLEILGSILATSTAKSVIDFVDDRISEYISKKFGNKPPEDIEALKKEVKELKTKLETKEKDDITQTDVEDVNKTIMKIKQKQSSLPDIIISDSIFQAWSERKLEIEDQALLLKRKLELLIDNSEELLIKGINFQNIKEMIETIDISLSEMSEAKRRARRFRLTSDEEKARAAEISLRDTIIDAGIFVKPYYGAN